MINHQKMNLTMLNDDKRLKSGFKRCWTRGTVLDGQGRSRTVKDGQGRARTGKDGQGRARTGKDGEGR
jgi:hypothetical protein